MICYTYIWLLFQRLKLLSECWYLCLYRRIQAINLLKNWLLFSSGFFFFFFLRGLSLQRTSVMTNLIRITTHFSKFLLIFLHFFSLFFFSYTFFFTFTHLQTSQFNCCRHYRYIVFFFGHYFLTYRHRQPFLL